MTIKPFALIILDGFGIRTELAHNPTRLASTPTIDALFKKHPYALLEASGIAVGLPTGQMGNSEVGHLHIGAGRKVPQDLTRVNNDIATRVFFDNAVLKNALLRAKKNNTAVHVLGLLSDGGVHSHIDHIVAMMEMIDQCGIAKNYLHAILDGRDTAPKSAEKFIQRMSPYIVSMIGRYFAMDRDGRWDRTERAYDLLTLPYKIPSNPPFSKGGIFIENSAENALKNAYARNETDEFISPTMILKHNQHITMQDNDVVIFMNFRADRARQLTRALIETNFSGFKRKKIIHASQFVTLTDYLELPNISVAYPPLTLHNTLGEYLSQQGLSQLRLAETEKYAHVTYFLNGGIETPNKNEFRKLIPSPKIATYDLQPEMSAVAVTDVLVDAIENKKYDVVICNYANPDMIGHTGNEKAAEKTMVVMDACLKRVLDALKTVNGEALITADHGNIELMYDEKTGQPHTAHTTNKVPLIYVGRPAKVISSHGALDDVAPTMLYLMGLKQPAEMTGKSLFQV